MLGEIGFVLAMVGVVVLVGRISPAVGGTVIGAAVAGLVLGSRRLFCDPLSINAISLATPFAAYALGTVAHVSGVLAVVIAGLIIGHQDPRLNTGASRLQTGAVWHLVGFLLEGFVFLLIGQQLPPVVRGLDQYSTGTIAATAGITVGLVLVLRPLWLVVTQHVPRWVHARLGGSGPLRGPDEPLSGREIIAVSWAGTRGVITLVAAFAIPLTTDAGAPFPARSLLLFSAYLVVLVTLLGQGTTFGPLLRRLGLQADVLDAARLRNRARTAAVDAALARLDQLTELPDQVATELRRGLTTRRERYRRRLAHLEDDPETLYSPGYEAAAAARRAIIDAQQEELLRWRDAGQLPDEVLRTLQRELDHEERTLPMPPQDA